MSNKAIGARMKFVRKHLNLTQALIADELDVTQARYSQMESGTANPTEKHLIYLYKKHRISSNYILHGLPPMVISKEATGALKTVEEIEKLTVKLKNQINGI